MEGGLACSTKRPQATDLVKKDGLFPVTGREKKGARSPK
jgi:hypothetical protein